MSDKLEQTVNAIKELVQLFRTERVVYLIISMLSVIVLIGTAVSMILKSESQDNTIGIMGLFGSSGGIIFSCGRLLKMWSEAIQLIQKAVEKNDTE